MRKLVVIAWLFVLQWKTKITVFTVVRAANFAAFLILVIRILRIGLLVIVYKKWENWLWHWQVVFWDTQNVYSALQAVCPLITANRLQCNVKARSKSRQMHLAYLEWSTGFLSWGQSERWRYKETWQRAWALGPRDGCYIRMISNETQAHYDTTVWLKETWPHASTPWPRDARPSGPEFESEKIELQSWWLGPWLGNTFQKWAKRF